MKKEYIGLFLLIVFSIAMFAVGSSSVTGYGFFDRFKQPAPSSSDIDVRNVQPTLPKPIMSSCPICIVNEQTWTKITLDYAEDTTITFQNGKYRILLKGTANSIRADLEISGFGQREVLTIGSSKIFNTLNVTIQDIFDYPGITDDSATLIVNNRSHVLMAGDILCTADGYDVGLMSTSGNRADLLVKGSIETIREVLTRGYSKQFTIGSGPKLDIVLENARDEMGVANDQAIISYRFS